MKYMSIEIKCSVIKIDGHSVLFHFQNPLKYSNVLSIRKWFVWWRAICKATPQSTAWKYLDDEILISGKLMKIPFPANPLSVCRSLVKRENSKPSEMNMKITFTCQSGSQCIFHHVNYDATTFEQSRMWERRLNFSHYVVPHRKWANMLIWSGEIALNRRAQ